MMTLSIQTTSTEDDQATVFWYVGMENHGSLKVDLNGATQDRSILAELCAIRHLVFKKQVFNVLPKSGHGIEIRSSTGAIKKLINGTSSKKDLRPYGLFAKPRLNDAVFSVSKKELPAQCRADVPETIDLNTVFSSWHEPIQVSSIGNVHITNHALERYVERVNQPDIKDPLESLLHRMQHAEFRKMDIPQPVLAHKARKYGKDDAIEVWGHPESTLRFLVARDHPEQATLLTVFRIAPQQRYL